MGRQRYISDKTPWKNMTPDNKCINHVFHMVNNPRCNSLFVAREREGERIKWAFNYLLHKNYVTIMLATPSTLYYHRDQRFTRENHDHSIIRTTLNSLDDN